MKSDSDATIRHPRLGDTIRPQIDLLSQNHERQLSGHRFKSGQYRPSSFRLGAFPRGLLPDRWQRTLAPREQQSGDSGKFAVCLE